MTFEQQIEAEHKRILKERDTVIKTMAVRLWGDLIEVSPLDTVELKGSWEPPKKIVGGWSISNYAPHVFIIDGGRRMENGKMYGSERLPDGYEPTVRRAETDMNKALGAIK